MRKEGLAVTSAAREEEMRSDDAGKGHKPRNAAASRNWKRHGNGFSLQRFQKQQTLLTF